MATTVIVVRTVNIVETIELKLSVQFWFAEAILTNRFIEAVIFSKKSAHFKNPTIIFKIDFFGGGEFKTSVLRFTTQRSFAFCIKRILFPWSESGMEGTVRASPDIPCYAVPPRPARRLQPTAAIRHGRRLSQSL